MGISRIREGDKVIVHAGRFANKRGVATKDQYEHFGDQMVEVQLDSGPKRLFHAENVSGTRM